MRVANPELYEKVKKYINSVYKKPSAFRSMAYIKEYKRRGGKFINDGRPKNLLRWMREKWRDVNPNKTMRSYPVFRPTRRISSKTPLTVYEIPRKVLISQSKKKQKIRGTHNLKAFGSFFQTRKNRIKN